MKKHVNLNQSSNPEGWSASIATAHIYGDKAISMGESILYPNKDTAWNSIKNEAQNLDYEEDEILFNREPVNSYQEMLNMVNAL